EDDLNALPPSRDNQLNTVKHRYRNVLPQPTEHSTNSREHGLNDRRNISLEPGNHGTNRHHDPIPSNLNAVPQPFSARSNTIPNCLHDRPQHVTEPIAHSRNRDLNASPRRINTITEPAHLLVHENKPSNKKRHGRNNQPNRVSLHRRVKNAHLHGSASSSELLCNQQAIPNSLTNSNRLQRQTVSRNATNNSGKDRPPFLKQTNDCRKNRRKLLNALNQRIRNGFNHRGEFVKHRNHGIADCVNNVVLSDLPLITKRLRSLISGLHHLLESLASAVLHHVHNVRDVDLPLGSHFLNLIDRLAELLRQARQNRHTRLRNHRQAIHHGDTAIIDSLHHAAHSLVKLRGVTTSRHDCLADVLKHARSVLALNARISQRLSSL